MHLPGTPIAVGMLSRTRQFLPRVRAGEEVADLDRDQLGLGGPIPQEDQLATPSSAAIAI
jgi:hypothetical protein